MCSFLLIFLVVIVTFTSLQDFAQQGHLSPQSPQEASPSKAVLVSFSKRTDFLEEERFAEDQIDSPKAPQSGHHFIAQIQNAMDLTNDDNAEYYPWKCPCGRISKNGQYSAPFATGPGLLACATGRSPRPTIGRMHHGKIGKAQVVLRAEPPATTMWNPVHHQDIDPINKDPLAEADMLAKGRTRAKRD